MNATLVTKNNRILVIDDNPAIHQDIRKILGRRGLEASMAEIRSALFEEAPEALDQIEFEIDSAFQGEEGLHKVQAALEAGRPYALAFVDVRMPPGWDGVETMTRIWHNYPDIQVVVCTAYSDCSWDKMIGQVGQSDSLLILKKPFDNIEVLQLAHALTRKWFLSQEVKGRLKDLNQLVIQRTSELQLANEQLKREITERMQMEKALRLSEERFSKAFKASPIPLALQALRSEQYVDANQGFQALTGYALDELIGHTQDQLSLWVDERQKNQMLQRLREMMSIHNAPCQLRAKSGQIIEVLLSVELFELDGEPFLLIIGQDISKQIRLENQLRQSQKMEAVGQLAAGVAHDFNNILTVIKGNSDLLFVSKPPDSADLESLRAICEAADRASKLVRQLLMFSRKQFVQMGTVKVQDTLESVAEMFPRLLGEDIAVQISAASDLPPIHADVGMMEQLLVNLAVNARDAMPQGGCLSVEAQFVRLGDNEARREAEAYPGEFVCLKIADSGCGIPSDVLPRIFEPFFTTKPVGKGTGLGLATVYGIVKQHLGWIEVESKVGIGTTFIVFIPVRKSESAPPPKPKTAPARGGRERILVVEDESAVRGLVVKVLRSYGYAVYEAASGPAALELWPQHRDSVDLLLTDMVMPGGLSGRQLADRLLADKPQLKVIYTSGYRPGMAGKDLAIPAGSDFLAKPYPVAKLLQLIRQSLDATVKP